MRLRLRSWLFCVLAVTPLQALACDWTENVWHLVCSQSPFFAPEQSQRQSAGVLQDDGGFALMVLGDPDQGALVSVNIPEPEVMATVTSSLVMPAGNILTRTVSGAQLWSVPTPDAQSVTYTFRVDPRDIALFQGARTWRVTAGQTTVNMTLKGSRVAIDAALAERDRSAHALGTDP